MALAQEINRIIGVGGHLPAFDGHGGLADTGTPAASPTFEQLTVNGPAGGGTNVTTAAIPATITPFYPQSISITVANTNGSYDGQVIDAYYVNSSQFSSPPSPVYDGASSDVLLEITLQITGVGTANLYFYDSGTGWNVGPLAVTWTPSGGLSGDISWNDEQGNSQTFDASVLGGIGSATPVRVDSGGNLLGVMTLQLSSVNTDSTVGDPAAYFPDGTIVFDNSGGPNSEHLYVRIGGAWTQLA
jgi:hypothetical protein